MRRYDITNGTGQGLNHCAFQEKRKTEMNNLSISVCSERRETVKGREQQRLRRKDDSSIAESEASVGDGVRAGVEVQP